MSAELIELSNALAQATERAAASAVAVHSEPRGSSSGVVWRSGIIVTAEHALRRDEEIQITLPDGHVIAASLVGRDPSTDLAVLKCAEASAAVPNFGDVTSLKPGSLTLVIGRTRASGPVAALGVVSLVAPERRTWTGAALAPYIRLDVALQPTAIGGAVVDTLLKKGHIPQGYLGVGLQPVRLPDALRQSLQRSEKTAAIVLEVEAESPAHKAGIVIGDILIALAGRSIARLEDVHSQLHGEAIGKPLALKFVRGGATQEVNIVVGERPRGGE